ncbi:STAS-like domain-containing protein [Stenotrophomonas rhizophila]|uniref:STAS-like domain-containing protein n=1 Tax=Stenotrophomonas rhizophila TaxID=216778 RepID=UPI003D18BCFC
MFIGNGLLTAGTTMTSLTSSSVFHVHEMCPNTTTRPNGMAARGMLRSALDMPRPITVDLEGVVLTPSFADEFLGVLLVELGEPEFRKALRIVNVEGASRTLLQQVLARRAARPFANVAAHNSLHAR